MSRKSLAVITDRNGDFLLSSLGSLNVSAVRGSRPDVCVPGAGTGEAEPNNRYNLEHLASSLQTIIQATKWISIPKKTVSSVEIGSASQSSHFPTLPCSTKSV